jgi:hypothetical protein
MVVGCTNCRALQKELMRNYFKMMRSYSFKKNKIVLIPQRTLVLLLFKYFEFDLEAISPKEIMEILGLSEKEFKGFRVTLLEQFVICL